MVKSLEDTARQLVTQLAHHPRITFPVDRAFIDFFVHTITSSYRPDNTSFAFKLPKGKQQQVVERCTFRVERTLGSEVETELVAPATEKREVFRYETSVELRRVLRNDQATRRLSAQKTPYSNSRVVWGHLRDTSFRYTLDLLFSGICRGYSSSSVVRRIPQRLREKMCEASLSYQDPSGSISLLAKMQRIDNTLQINPNGFLESKKPYFVITVPLLCIDNVDYGQDGYKDPTVLADRSKVPGFEESCVRVEKAIPHFLGGQRAFLFPVSKAYYRRAIEEYLAKNPNVRAALEAKAD
jgi:hypothetical protein